MTTKAEFWQWLENSFAANLRAQQWYNADPPRYLNGYLNDKTNRLIGWSVMKQFRVRAESCLSRRLESQCEGNYRSSDEETRPFYSGSINRTFERAFQYRSKTSETVAQSIDGEHGAYPTGYQGYLYDFRGRLADLQSNLSALHQHQWIDQYTRAILIQIYLYNPNIELFTSVSILVEFIATGSIHPHIIIDPIYFHRTAENFFDCPLKVFSLLELSSLSQWICVLLLLVVVFYFTVEECRRWIEEGRKYLRRLASWLEWGFIACFIVSVVFYIHQYEEMKRLGTMFQQTNGYSYVDMKRLTTYHQLFSTFMACTCFLATLRFLQFCQYHHHLSAFTRTLSRVSSELIAFSFMFSFVFIAFLCLFYFLFIAEISTCATLSATTRMLFEMSLLKFDAHELTDAASMLGPITFALYIIIVVFICLSMFLSIINDNYRAAREESNEEYYGEQIFSMMRTRVVGLFKRSQ